PRRVSRALRRESAPAAPARVPRREPRRASEVPMTRRFVRVLTFLAAAAPLALLLGAQSRPAPPAGTPSVQQPRDVSLIIERRTAGRIPVAVPPPIAPFMP